MQKCTPKMRKNKKNWAENENNKVIFDTCYKYSRQAKERFFKNPHCSMLFLLSKQYVLKAINSDENRNIL